MYTNLSQLIQEYQNALHEEIRYINNDLRKRGVTHPIKVQKGKLIEENGNGFLYRFTTLDLDTSILPDTQTIFVRGNERIKGFVENCNVDSSTIDVQ